jgi:hypothetical protein
VPSHTSGAAVGQKATFPPSAEEFVSVWYQAFCATLLE